jgi:hypothetical protein
LSNGEPTAFQYGNTFILFNHCGVEVYDAIVTTKLQFDIKETIWALSGSNTQPCYTFLNLSHTGKAWIVHAATLAADWWHHWYETCKASFYVMESFTPDELKALRLVITVTILFCLTSSHSQVAQGQWDNEDLQGHVKMVTKKLTDSPGTIEMKVESEPASHSPRIDQDVIVQSEVQVDNKVHHFPLFTGNFTCKPILFDG